MVRPGDAVLPLVREIALSFPQAQERISHGRPMFFTKRSFCMYGGVVKGDHHSDRYAQSILVLLEEATREAIDSDDRFFVPAYWGPHGWRGLDLTAAEPDWAEVRELIDESYRITAPKKLIAELDRAGNTTPS